MSAERQKLRADKLKELYEYHHDNGGKSKRVLTECVEDVEARLAYDYLSGHGLITFEQKVNAQEELLDAKVRINSRGIDKVESVEINAR